MTGSIWNQIQQQWPAMIEGQAVSYPALRKRVGDFLKQKSIAYQAFSHFGIVVSSIEQTLELISKLIGKPTELPVKEWVQAYQVYVARISIEQQELELIEPTGKNFFAVSLENQGSCLQHISFNVEDIDEALAVFKNSKIALIDEKPNCGSHGKVAFSQPALFEPLYLELCQLHV